MDNIKDIVSQVIDQMSQRRPSATINAEFLIKKIFKINELEHVKFVGEREGKLFFLVDSPAWLFQMKTKKANILKIFQDEMPSIKDLYFKMGKVV